MSENITPQPVLRVRGENGENGLPGAVLRIQFFNGLTKG